MYNGSHWVNGKKSNGDLVGFKKGDHGGICLDQDLGKLWFIKNSILVGKPIQHDNLKDH